MPEIDYGKAIEQNNYMRNVLLSTAPEFRKVLQTVTGITAGSTSRIKLFNTGILTKLALEIQVAITIGTATATPSSKAPWNLISRLRLTDFDGTDRVNLSGYQLFVLNCVRNRNLDGFNNEAGSNWIVNPSVPTAVGTANLLFDIDVPVAYDPANKIPQLRDLRGAIMMQTAVGEMYLTIDWITSLYTNGDDDALYRGGATSTVAAGAWQVSVAQEFLFPQAIGSNGALPLPTLDLMTVYECLGFVRTSDNISQNAERLFNYPNVRSVLGFYANFTNNKLLAGTAFSGMRTLANGSQNVKEWQTERSFVYDMRRLLNTDLPAGTFFVDHRNRPIETQLYGNFQFGMTPNIALTTPNFETMTESFYSKGMALPGIGQSG